eukprot:3346538-Amphidinium_carterae.1
MLALYPEPHPRCCRPVPPGLACFFNSHTYWFTHCALIAVLFPHQKPVLVVFRRWGDIMCSTASRCILSAGSDLRSEIGSPRSNCSSVVPELPKEIQRPKRSPKMPHAHTDGSHERGHQKNSPSEQDT